MKNVLKFFILVFFFFVFVGCFVVQVEFLEDKVKWKYKVEQKGCDVIFIVEIFIVLNWYIYVVNLLKGVFVIFIVFQLDNFKNY